jgi:hypothetical protein
VSAPPPRPPLSPTHTYKFKRFGVSAFPDKKFPVEAVPSLATRQLFSCTFLENFLIKTRKKPGEIASMEVGLRR